MQCPKAFQEVPNFPHVSELWGEYWQRPSVSFKGSTKSRKNIGYTPTIQVEGEVNRRRIWSLEENKGVCFESVVGRKISLQSNGKNITIAFQRPQIMDRLNVSKKDFERTMNWEY